jgi:hypothetical protein
MGAQEVTGLLETAQDSVNKCAREIRKVFLCESSILDQHCIDALQYVYMQLTGAYLLK